MIPPAIIGMSTAARWVGSVGWHFRQAKRYLAGMIIDQDLRP